MIILGMLIGDRYEILDKIGTGGMSDVYKAKDHKLNRLVAVKVLKQEFNENTNFVSKFRVEAQAAAGLMHSNIVNVYDVGEEDGIYYIVMELVEGITLKNYIEKKSRLSIKEAISIAIQVSMGIEAAHNNHIIHRDIKPQNIMISKDGKVKVTDFGIAKAATSNTITSNVMGSVHYTSPEQARGGFSDEKSDIYSLGCTLFEMLTGHVPFDGETTVAIAIKHIQDEMPSAREYVSEIPVSVEKIIYKCTQKSPDRRYQSMAELIIDLKKSLITPDEDFVTMVDIDASAATKALTEEDMAEIKERTGVIAVDEVHMRLNEEAKAKKKIAVPLMWDTDDDDDEDEDEEYEADVDDDDDEYDDDDMDPKMERITTILAIVAAVIIGVIALVLVANAVGIFKGGNDEEEQQIQQTQDIEMVGVVGMDIEVAKVTLEEIYVIPEIEYQESEEIPENKVISQSVQPGSMVSQGSTVKLVVSSGVAAVEIPDVVGKEESEAVAILYEAGFKVSTDTDYSDDVETGFVISSNPVAGEKVANGTMITLIVSIGPEAKKTEVPDLRGLSESAAKDKLAAANLKAGTITEDYNDSVTAGCVISQSYSPDMEVEEGTSVDFVLSLGKKEVKYEYVGSINAPTGYTGGSVTITITAADGETRTFTTDAFPFAVNETGFKVENGNVNISGTKTETTQEQKIDEAGNPVVDENGAPVYDTIETQVPVDFGTQAITFTKVQ
ncbi:MAG: Stk1 family PASTA domain-containing Ser/Thr kinase [Lachnospiraceae bacterium]|nr:Stk1 family PASTA domain-containing Ser/Thr kinase [Lachnospiraceae bacterium]